MKTPSFFLFIIFFTCVQCNSSEPKQQYEEELQYLMETRDRLDSLNQKYGFDLQGCRDVISQKIRTIEWAN